MVDIISVEKWAAENKTDFKKIKIFVFPSKKLEEYGVNLLHSNLKPKTRENKKNGESKFTGKNKQHDTRSVFKERSAKSDSRGTSIIFDGGTFDTDNVDDFQDTAEPVEMFATVVAGVFFWMCNTWLDA